jgi:hypothetical protein
MKVIDADLFASIASQVAYKNSSAFLDQRSMIAFYGVGTTTMNDLWHRCERPEKTKPEHLCWTLMYYKLYNPDDVMAVLCGCCKNTLGKWVGQWTDALAHFSEKVILWENRFRNAPDNVWCFVSVDGTDFKVCEPSPFHKGWKSPKLEGSAIKYEVAVSIYSGDIVWIHGPYKGSKNDVAVFNDALKDMLEEGEMVEADKGYKYVSIDKRRTPKDCESFFEWVEKSDVRARQEHVNHRFKVFGILKQEFRKHDLTVHGQIFKAIAGMVQYEISRGRVMMQIQPTTKKTPGQYSTSNYTTKKDTVAI